MVFFMFYNIFRKFIFNVELIKCRNIRISGFMNFFKLMFFVY